VLSFQDRLRQDKCTPQPVDIIAGETLPRPPASPCRPERCYRAFKLGGKIESVQQLPTCCVDEFRDRPAAEDHVHTRCGIEPYVRYLIAIPSLPVCDPDRASGLCFTELLCKFVHGDHIGKCRIVGIT
jgi:hypothetical protein